jgi:uncharacterized RDD family membrane protein YckC
LCRRIRQLFQDIRVDNPDLEYVGFWMRFWAFIIDSILAAILLWPLLRIYGGDASYYLAPWSWSDSTFVFTRMDPRIEVLNWVLPALAVLIFWAARQATPGKMAIGARIVDADTGAKPSTAQFIGRYFAYYVSLFVMCLGFFWIAIDSRKQGWHDKLANTVVVRHRRGASAVQFKSQPPPPPG